jgi:hypothetical protein
LQQMKGNCPALHDYYFLTTSDWLLCRLDGIDSQSGLCDRTDF